MRFHALHVGQSLWCEFAANITPRGKSGHQELATTSGKPGLIFEQLKAREVALTVGEGVRYAQMLSYC